MNSLPPSSCSGPCLSFYAGQVMRLRDFVVCIVSIAAVEGSFAMRKSSPADSRADEVASQ